MNAKLFQTCVAKMENAETLPEAILASDVMLASNLMTEQNNAKVCNLRVYFRNSFSFHNFLRTYF